MQLAPETEPTFSMGSCSANTRFPSQSNSWTVHGYTEGLYEMPSLPHSGSHWVFYQNKIQEACSGQREEGKGRILEASLLPFPFPWSLVHFLFFSPQPPWDTERPLRRREWQTQLLCFWDVVMFVVSCLKCCHMYNCLLYLGMFFLSLVKILETWL